MKVRLRISKHWGVDVRTFLLDWRRAHKVRRAIERQKVL